VSPVSDREKKSLCAFGGNAAQARAGIDRRGLSGCGILLLALGVAIAVAPAPAWSNARDTATTNAYLKADYALVRTVSSNLARSEAALQGLLAHVRSACPEAAAGSPQTPESTLLSDELIGTMVLTGGHVDRAAVQAYVSKVAGLRWSDQGLSRAIGSHVADLRTLLGLQTPDICADVKSWATSAFKVLPVRTVQFAHVFIEGWVRPGNQPSQLTASEGASERALARRAEQAEWHITDFESEAVETWGKIMDALLLWP
jgi:hypothetical protein